MGERFTLDPAALIYQLLDEELDIPVWREPPSDATKRVPFVVYSVVTPTNVPNGKIQHGTRFTLVLSVVASDYDSLSEEADRVTQAVMEFVGRRAEAGWVSHVSVGNLLTSETTPLPAQDLQQGNLTFTITARKG